MNFHDVWVKLMKRGLFLVLLVFTIVLERAVVAQAQEWPAPRVGGAGQRGNNFGGGGGHDGQINRDAQERRRSSCNLKGGTFLAADQQDHGAYDACFCEQRQSCIQMGSDATGSCSGRDPSDLTLCPIGNHAMREHLRALCVQMFPGVLAHHVQQIEAQQEQRQSVTNQQMRRHRSEVVHQNAPLLAGSAIGAAMLGGLAYQILSLLWTGRSCHEALTKKSSEASFSAVRLTSGFYAARTAQILEVQKLLRSAQGVTGIRPALFGIRLQPVARGYENFLRAISPRVGAAAEALGRAVSAYSAERAGAVAFLSEMDSFVRVLDQELARLSSKDDSLRNSLVTHRSEILNASENLRSQFSALFQEGPNNNASGTNSVSIDMTPEGQALSQAKIAWTNAVDGLWTAIETQVSTRAAALVDATTRGPQSNRIRGVGTIMGLAALGVATAGGIAGFALPMSHYTTTSQSADDVARSQQDSSLQALVQGSQTPEQKLNFASQRIGSRDLDYLLQNYPLTGIVDSPEVACRAIVRSQLGSDGSRLPSLYTQIQERSVSIQRSANQGNHDNPGASPPGGQ